MNFKQPGTRRALMAALSWIACMQFFVAEQIVSSAWTLPYSFATNYVSDLGNTVCSASICSPWHLVMNASFVVQGLLIGGGAALASVHRQPVERIWLALLEVCGLALIVVGCVPENTHPVLHRFAAAIHFLAGGFGMIAAGVTLRGWFGCISVAAGFVVVASVVELGQSGGTLARLIGIGALERIAAYAIAGWMVLLGVWSYSRLIGDYHSRT